MDGPYERDAPRHLTDRHFGRLLLRPMFRRLSDSKDPERSFDPNGLVFEFQLLEERLRIEPTLHRRPVRTQQSSSWFQPVRNPQNG